MRLSKNVIAAIVVIAIVAGGAAYWFFLREDGGKSADERVAEQVEEQDRVGLPEFPGSDTEPPRYYAEKGKGDNGGDVVESLPELSVPMNQSPSYYVKSFCDKARMYENLSQEKNRAELRKWFVEAPAIVQPYAKDDKTLTTILDASKSSNGDPATILKACP